VLNVFCDGSITGGAWAKKKDAPSLPHSWCGYIIKTEEGDYVHHHTLDLGEGELRSANFSEHWAVNSALRWIVKNRPGERVRIHTDSQLTIGHLSGVFQINNPILAEIATNTLALVGRLPMVYYKWIRRAQNTEADILSKALQPGFWGRLPTLDELAAAVAIWPKKPCPLPKKSKAVVVPTA